MKNLSKILLTSTLIAGTCITSITAFASSKYNSPADIVSELTGRTTESIIEEHTSKNKTYGTIAKEASKLNEFKKENIKFKKEQINEKVANGTLTKAEGEKIIKDLETNQANCDGNGSNNNKIRLKLNKGNGKGAFKGNGSCINK
ncbi:hypothetical protein ACFO6R_05300 [Eubacterium multiforme]|uniref:DUF2680 domain-containing protein n=1 Tax=Eubacterium multiforme TaxID=83339 RepID=A0ABT9URH6_9FIRM|nr:hypothetical protein [Eubacterium multiforme]MDQ0148996.1 hypothetical protein [Eubacterium multiforme]